MESLLLDSMILSLGLNELRLVNVGSLWLEMTGRGMDLLEIVLLVLVPRLLYIIARSLSATISF